MEWKWSDLWTFVIKHGDSVFAYLGSVAVIVGYWVKKSADKQKHKQELVLRDFDQTIKEKDKLAAALDEERQARARSVDQQIRELEHDLEIEREKVRSCEVRLGERNADLEQARANIRELENQLREARAIRGRNERR